MGRHDRAWEGLQIVIVGSTPMLPMQIEQAFAESSPGNELRISSFESYEDAHDFVKRSRDVGFLVVLENCGKLSASQVFRELAKPYEMRGFPAFGVMVHEGAESFAMLRLLKSDRRILDYLNATELSGRSMSASTLDQLWERFVASFEEFIIPTQLQESLMAIAERQNGSQDLMTYNRVINSLSTDLNLSWLEMFAVRQAPVIHTISKTDSAVLDPHPQIVSMVTIAEFPVTMMQKSIEEIAKEKISLAARLACIAQRLSSMAPDALSEEMTRLSSVVKPGAPAILRHLARLKDRIVEFAKEDSKSMVI